MQTTWILKVTEVPEGGQGALICSEWTA